MSSSVSALARATRFFDAPIGKKAVMALTGAILSGFVLAHMAGNLQIYLPQHDGVYPIDAYGAFLHGNAELLWGARLALLASVVLHIASAAALLRQKSLARPVEYVRRKPIASSYASRTMYWSGPILAFFIIYHLLHFTTGTVHPEYQFLHVRDNVIKGFSVWYVSLFYIVSMVLLCLHLYHGVWSMFQSLGVAHPEHTRRLKRLAALFAIAVAAGNISIPVAVMWKLVA